MCSSASFSTMRGYLQARADAQHAGAVPIETQSEAPEVHKSFEGNESKPQWPAGTSYLLVPQRDSDDPRRYLWDEPESGPGYQIVDVPDASHDDASIPRGEYIVFNSELFVPAPPSDAAIPHEAGTSYPDYLRRCEIKSALSPRVKVRWPARHATILKTRTTAGEVFWRLSAYAKDHRITADRALRAGTYVTSDSDIGVVGSGFAAVGRYALPNPFPAIYAFAVRPEPGTPIVIGTCRPGYGQSGGGVEAIVSMTGDWTVSNHVRVLQSW